MHVMLTEEEIKMAIPCHLNHHRRKNDMQLNNNYRAHFPNSMNNVVKSHGKNGKKITWVSRHKKGRKSMKAINMFESIQGGIGDICNSKSMYIRYGTERMFQLSDDSV